MLSKHHEIEFPTFFRLNPLFSSISMTYSKIDARGGGALTNGCMCIAPRAHIRSCLRSLSPSSSPLRPDLLREHTRFADTDVLHSSKITDRDATDRRVGATPSASAAAATTAVYGILRRVMIKLLRFPGFLIFRTPRVRVSPHRHTILSPIRYLNTLSLNSLKAKREIERESGRIYSDWRLASSSSSDYTTAVNLRHISRTGASASYLHRANSASDRRARVKFLRLMQKSDGTSVGEFGAVDYVDTDRRRPICEEIKNVRDKAENKWINCYCATRALARRSTPPGTMLASGVVRSNGFYARPPSADPQIIRGPHLYKFTLKKTAGLLRAFATAGRCFNKDKSILCFYNLQYREREG
ncbi:hypothetical protein PUN28_006511 [Cardiocondyla obscurior]|uniref:Uncharacterized protein n=1 Tax=Cardiocondyla obscurior TaxID=286306 RepID=A0AAW2G8Z8_9HYME